VAVNSFKDQANGIKKLFIEDWRREGYAYPTAFQGEQYHLVQDCDSPHFRIEPNQVILSDRTSKMRASTNFNA